MSETTTAIVPHLCCRNGAEAVEFYQKAFGAEPEFVLKAPDGNLMHATMSIGGAKFHLANECVEYGNRSPLTLGGTPVTIHLHVADSDAVFQRAVEAGCEVRMPLENMFWGDRYGLVVDPYGHLWGISSTVKTLTPDEIREAAASFFGGGEVGGCGA